MIAAAANEDSLRYILNKLLFFPGSGLYQKGICQYINGSNKMIIYGNNPYICYCKNYMMETKTRSGGSARFDTRLSREQKDYLEYAARLGGYRTLSEFIINSAQEKAQMIVKEHDLILKSDHDREIFFAELSNPGIPNQELQLATEKYMEYIRKNELSD